MKHKTMQQTIIAAALHKAFEEDCNKLIIGDKPNKYNTNGLTYTSQKVEETKPYFDIEKLRQLKSLIQEEWGKPEFIYILSKEHYLELQGKNLKGRLTEDEHNTLVAYAQLDKLNLAIFTYHLNKGEARKIPYQEYIDSNKTFFEHPSIPLRI